MCTLGLLLRRRRRRCRPCRLSSHDELHISGDAPTGGLTGSIAKPLGCAKALKRSSTAHCTAHSSAHTVDKSCSSAESQGGADVAGQISAELEAEAGIQIERVLQCTGSQLLYCGARHISAVSNCICPVRMSFCIVLFHSRTVWMGLRCEQLHGLHWTHAGKYMDRLVSVQVHCSTEQAALSIDGLQRMRAIGQLQHRNIAAVLSAKIRPAANGFRKRFTAQAWLVQDIFRGGALADALAQGAFSPARLDKPLLRVLLLLLDVAHALAALHKRELSLETSVLEGTELQVCFWYA